MKWVLGILGFLFLLGVILYAFTTSKNTPLSPTPPVESDVKDKAVLFPTSTDTLTAGEEYTIQWTAGSGTTQLFLIDTSLETQGASVSIVDRVYNIPNSGTYSYIVPARLPAGIYKLTIGELTSESFPITTQKSDTDTTSYCTPTNLRATVVTEGAAGNLYGKFTLKNTSSNPCLINMKEYVKATYNEGVNIFQTFEDASADSPHELAPNATIYSQFRAPNGPQCGESTHTEQVTFFYYPGPEGKVTFQQASGEQTVPITVCDNSDQTVIHLWNFSPNQLLSNRPPTNSHPFLTSLCLTTHQ